jgi:hypothetical protein
MMLMLCACDDRAHRHDDDDQEKVSSSGYDPPPPEFTCYPPGERCVGSEVWYNCEPVRSCDIGCVELPLNCYPGVTCREANHPCAGIFGLDPWNNKQVEVDCDGDPGNGLEQLLLDPDHCGACGHSCLGGNCTAGLCDPMAVPSSDLVAAFAADETLFYLGYPDRIVRFDPQDKTSVTLVDVGVQDLRDLAVDAEFVYWTEQSAQKRIAKGGGAPTLLASAHAVQQILLTSTHVALLSQLALASVPKDGGDVVELAAGPWDSLALPIAANQTEVFFADGNAIYRVSPATGPVEVLAIGTGIALAADEAAVYVASGGTVTALSLAGGVSIELATDQPSPARIVVDDIHVYWTNSGTWQTGNCGAGALRVAKAGGDATVLHCVGYGYMAPSLSGFALDHRPAIGGGWLLANVGYYLLALPK